MKKSTRKNSKVKRMDGEVSLSDQQTLSDFYTKLDQNNSAKKETVMTSTNFEEDEDIGYNIMKSKSQKGKLIITKNEDIELDKMKKLVGNSTLDVISDVITKIFATESVNSKLKILNNYASLYNLDEFHINFICSQTGVIRETDTKSLEELHDKVCASDELKKFYDLPNKTRRAWMKTKSIILFEFLMLAMSQRDDVTLGKDFVKYFAFQLDTKTSQWNEFTGFILMDDIEEDAETGYLLYRTSIETVSKKNNLKNAKREAESYFTQTYEWAKYAGKKVLETSGKAAVNAANGLYGVAKDALLAARRRLIGYDGKKTSDGKKIILGEKNVDDATSPYAGHYIFLMYYLDHIINTCAKKHLAEHNWKWSLDEDDLEPYDDCKETLNKLKICQQQQDAEAREEERQLRIAREDLEARQRKFAQNRLLNEAAVRRAEEEAALIEEALRLRREQEAARGAPPERGEEGEGRGTNNDGSRQQYKRSKKYLKKQLKEGQISKEVYRSKKKSIKNKFLY